MLCVDLHREAMAIRDRHAPPSSMPLHQPAMVPQVLALLRPAQGHSVLDLTVGTGGHALAIARCIGPDGFLVGVDADREAIDVARERLQAPASCRFELFAERFSRAADVARKAGVAAFDAALADLGVGSHQLDQPSRGFSFDSQDRLNMLYDTTAGPSAWEVINKASERDLAEIFFRYGEERHSRAIAARICRRRAEAPINTPAELAALVKGVAARRARRRRTWRIHPATRVMMALRIHVNHEMEELEALLSALPPLIKKGGRAAVLTYHSLEARRVKEAWGRQEKEGLWQSLTPSPLTPSEEQVTENPRIRSAQLRAVQRL